MPLSQSQGQALTALLHTIRKDWGLAGITAALKHSAHDPAFCSGWVTHICGANLDPAANPSQCGPGSAISDGERMPSLAAQRHAATATSAADPSGLAFFKAAVMPARPQSRRMVCSRAVSACPWLWESGITRSPP